MWWCTQSSCSFAVLDPSLPSRVPPSSVLRVLLVEGDLDLRDVLREIVTDAGHDAVAVATASAARAALLDGAGGPPDLVILDHVLPDGGSGDLVDALADHVARPAVVLLCGAIRDEARRDAEARGWVILPLPFDHDDLVRVLVEAGRSRG